MKLAEKLKREPSAAKLFVETHSKVDENGQRIWCDAHAHSVYEKYEQLKADTKVQVSTEADDHLFFKACGVRVKNELYTNLVERVNLCLRDHPSLGIPLQVLHQHTPHH